MEDTIAGDAGHEGNLDNGFFRFDHFSSSRTWSDVLMGRKCLLASLPRHEVANGGLPKKVGSSLNMEQAHNSGTDEESLSLEAQRIYETTKLSGLQAKEGYEEQFINKIRSNLGEERLNKETNFI